MKIKLFEFDLAVLLFAGLLSLTLQSRGAAATPDSQLSIALCTPEESDCYLANDGNFSSCFAARQIQDNFYFAVFNTVGQPSTVSQIKLLVGGGGRTNYTVSLASEARAHDLRCAGVTDEGDATKSTSATPRILDCRTVGVGGAFEGLANVSSLMIRSEPLPVRLRLLEVAAYTKQRKPLTFAYCTAQEPAVCARAMDGDFAPTSPLAQSSPAAFPYWMGGFNVNTDKADAADSNQVAFVRIYRPDNAGATFFRVNAGVECDRIADDAPFINAAVPAGVEAIDYACPTTTAVSSLLQVWEIDADFLVNLCEVQAIGHQQ